MVGVLIPEGPLAALIQASVAGSGALLLYVLFARALGVTELTELMPVLRR